MTTMATASVDRLFFDGDDLGSDAFARYAEIYSAGAETFRIGDRFRARVEAWRLDGLILYHRRLDGVGHRRTKAMVDATGFTHFTATLLLGGQLELEGPGMPTVRLSTPGEVVLMDTRRVGTNRMFDAEMVTCAIPRSRLEAIVADVDSLCGAVLPAPHTRLVHDYAMSLLAALPSLPDVATPTASSVLISLLSTAIASWDVERSRAPSTREGGRLAKLLEMVDRRIPDAEFDAAALVRESSLSRATLYRLTDHQGGLATIIRHRRLDRIRRHLNDPHDLRSFAQIAASVGLPRAPAAAAAFAKRYAMSPTEYRRLASHELGADVPHKMLMWQEEVARRRFPL